MKINNPRIVAIIPARYGSTRFPGKSLVMIKDKPMIQWVYERTKQSKLIDRIIVATDDERIRSAVATFGGEAMMTSPDHSTGTDRIAEIARKLACDIVVNVQGDEPLIHHEMIDQAIKPLVDDPSIPMGTLCTAIKNHEEAFDPNVVKVVCDKNGFALYFSRAPIPWDRDSWSGKKSWNDMAVRSPLYKHIGLYVYRADFLLNYASMPQTVLESIEKLEQLRALEHGHRIKTVLTLHDSFGVDIPGDLSKILKRLEES
jgi:3-deoxy-manno-octulosonate cytidylyltransferase (CMP-KDO synthetase)